MTNSYFPKGDASLVVWCTNYKEKILANASVLNLTPEQVATEIGYCDSLIESITNTNNQRNVLKGIIETKKQAIQMQGGALRTEIGRHKMLPTYSETIGQELGIVSTFIPFDPTTYKPKISSDIFGGFIRIKFRKLGADGINIYQRKKSSSTWQFLARATKSPFQFTLTLEVPNQPEHWEYRAFGVIDDNEIGSASDIIEVVYGS
jgi:hypothetical protein